MNHISSEDVLLNSTIWLYATGHWIAGTVSLILTWICVAHESKK